MRIVLFCLTALAASTAAAAYPIVAARKPLPPNNCGRSLCQHLVLYILHVELHKMHCNKLLVLVSRVVEIYLVIVDTAYACPTYLLSYC